MANSGSQKQKGSAISICERDKLSELPDEVIVHILSFLPTLDAVRTVLLRRFGNLWTSVHTLNFSEDQFGDLENDTVLFSRYSLFVFNVLIHHKRPTINKFHLKIASRYWTDEEKEVAAIGIEVWVRFVLSREAKALILDIDNARDLFPMPASVFTSRFLVNLKLERCSIRFPSRVHMGALRTLLIICSAVEDGDLNEFVCGCPSIQELILRDVDGFRLLSFSAPSIEKLELLEADPTPSRLWTINCPKLKILDLFVYLDVVDVVNVTSVRELTIGFFYYNDTEVEEDAHQFKRFLEGCGNIEVLTLTEQAVLQLTYCLMVNVGLPQIRWKRVVLKSLIQETNIAGICCLVRNSPCLEELIIHADQDTDFRLRGDSDFVSQEATSPSVAPYLKLVSMHLYGKPCDGLLQLAEFLLKSAVNLDKVVIFSHQGSRLTSVEEPQFVKQLLNLSRVSTKARIVFS